MLNIDNETKAMIQILKNIDLISHSSLLQRQL